MTIPDEAVQAASKRIDEYYDTPNCVGETAVRAALTSALPFLQGVKPGSLVNDANIIASDMPHTVVKKLDAAYETRVLSAIEPAPPPRAQALEFPTERVNMPEPDSDARIIGFRIREGDKQWGRSGLYEPMQWLNDVQAAALSSQPVADGVDSIEVIPSSGCVFADMGVERPVADGWLPIETAPTDETLFLAYCPADEDFPDGRMMIWKGSIFAFQKNPTPRHLQFPATHWRPLPASPGALATRPTGGSDADA